jgi:site-specific DNA recombinase
MRACIYARFSSANQHQESIEAQVTACKAYCKRKGYKVVKIYVDEAKTGKEHTLRYSYNDMLEDAKNHAFEVVIFHKIDRNARNEIDYYSDFKREMIKYGITYEYAAQPIDSSAEGQFMEAVMVGQAAYYSRNLSKEVKVKMKEYAKKSQFLGGVPPLGYKIVNKHYVIDETEAPTIRLIFKMYANGYGYNKIINELNTYGKKTKLGRPFAKNSLHDILCNPKYCGTFTYNKVIKTAIGSRNTHLKSPEVVVNYNAIPAIIPQADFDYVQEIMAKHKRCKGTHVTRRNYLLSGLITCGLCGRAYSAKTSIVGKNSYSFYACSGKLMRGKDYQCDNIRLKVEDLNTMVVNGIIENFTKDDIDDIVSRTYDRFNNEENKKYITALKEKLNGAELRLNSFYDTFNGTPLDEFDKERLSALKQEITQIKADIKRYTDMTKVKFHKDEIYVMWAEFITELRQKNNDTLKPLLQRIIKAIKVFPDRIEIYLNLCRFVDAAGPSVILPTKLIMVKLAA